MWQDFWDFHDEGTTEYGSEKYTGYQKAVGGEFYME